MKSRFSDTKKMAAVVAIRAAESFDRYTVLKQGDYHTGRYGTQYDFEVDSPFFDLTTEDLWKVNTCLGFDSNYIYDMMWDAGVPLATMRIGSPLNEHAGDSVKLFKVLNPGTYSKMVGRLDGVDFVAGYGGVFQKGFKYINLPKLEAFKMGSIESEPLARAINYLNAKYILSEDKKEYFPESRPVSVGDRIIMFAQQAELWEESARKKAISEGNKELEDYFSSHMPKQKTWYDYACQLINSAEPMFQKGWRKKTIASMKAWKYRGIAVNEATVDALRILAEANSTWLHDPNETWNEYIDWALVGFLPLSSKPMIKYYSYPQDCAENTVAFYLNNIVDNWDNGGKEEFENNKFLTSMLYDDNNSSLFTKVLGVSVRNASAIPWGTTLRQIVTGDASKDSYLGEVVPEDIRDTIKNLAYYYFHDQVRESASWKRVTIACLRNDIKFTYLGFGQSEEEKAIRLNAEIAFAESEIERKKKIEELEKWKRKNAENADL